jgi:phosphotriesterase-related protein
MTGTTRRQALQLLAAATVLAPLRVPAQAASFPKGAVIRTLFRDYAPAELAGGATLFHEHLSMGPDFMARFSAANAAVLAARGEPPPQRPVGPPPMPGADPMRDVNLMAEELRTARNEGVSCIVDASLEGTGMDLAFIREAARKSGLAVVKGAGFYSEPFYPAGLEKLSEQQILERLIKQVDEYPAGAFGEIGSWDEISATERRVFRAIGKAHVATNLPVFTHTGIPGKSALEQLDLLEDAGVDPRRVAIGHLGNLGDPTLYVHKTLCRRGAFVCFDRQGGGEGSDAPVVPLVKGLVDAGFADQLLFSGDAFRRYGRVLTSFVPRMKAAGLGDEVLRRIMVDNPRRFLAFVPKRPRRAAAT